MIFLKPEIIKIINNVQEKYQTLVEYFSGDNFNCIPLFDSNNLHLFKKYGGHFRIAIFFNIDNLNLFFPKIIELVVIRCKSLYLIGNFHIESYDSNISLLLC